MHCDHDREYELFSLFPFIFMVFTPIGVQKIMVPGSSVKSSKEALRLSRIYPTVIFSTAGRFRLISLQYQLTNIQL